MFSKMNLKKAYKIYPFPIEKKATKIREHLTSDYAIFLIVKILQKKNLYIIIGLNLFIYKLLKYITYL